MSGRGRPQQSERPLAFRVTLLLQPALHAALITYLQSAPPRLRAQYVIRAMQSGVESMPAPLTETPKDDLAFDQLWQ